MSITRLRWNRLGYKCCNVRQRRNSLGKWWNDNGVFRVTFWRNIYTVWGNFVRFISKNISNMSVKIFKCFTSFHTAHVWIGFMLDHFDFWFPYRLDFVSRLTRCPARAVCTWLRWYGGCSSADRYTRRTFEKKLDFRPKRLISIVIRLENPKCTLFIFVVETISVNGLFQRFPNCEAQARIKGDAS